MYRIEILKAATFDLKDSSSWYESRQQGLGKRFQKSVFATLKTIQKRPLIYPVKFLEEFRFAKVDKFPFFIVFEIVEDKIVVNSIFHTSRNPSRF
ncbi:type II toxin-antitoxin system RelE/ParE family toxin [Mucilaginibacter rigui]|uniref:type II toxin-antitoxin system RelE/ParE family toxin n=1 Tax=Mucilaginibacter rigui TaxID=534635 RepID=UPI0037449A2F